MIRPAQQLSTDAKSYFVMGWLFGAFGGSFTIVCVFFSGYSDSPLPHPAAWLVVGIAVLAIGAASALVLAIGARTRQGRVLAVAAFGLTFLLPLLGIAAGSGG